MTVLAGDFFLGVDRGLVDLDIHMQIAFLAARAVTFDAGFVGIRHIALDLGLGSYGRGGYQQSNG